jgi:hypothetical protein
LSTARPHVYSTNVVSNANESAANTETVVATLVGVSAEFAQQVVQFIGAVAITPGTTTTAMTVRVRRDSLTGTLVDTADVHTGDVVASKLSVLTFSKTDAPGELAGRTYVVTIQGAGEGTAAAIAAAMVTAIVS